MAHLRTPLGVGADVMTSAFRPYDPLDPQERLERGRERTAFFRQAGLFPLALITMVAFVAITLWQKSWAIPFLGWMFVVPPALGLVIRDLGERSGVGWLRKVNGYATAPLAIGLFVALAVVHFPAVCMMAVFVLAAAAVTGANHLWGSR